MYNKSFTLKQHSPLIHFQHDKEGATLRATEVKPKLDALIKERAKKSIRPEWIRREEGDDIALSYKLRITGQASEEYLVASNVPKYMKQEYGAQGIQYLAKTPYFADNEHIKKGATDQARRAVMYQNLKVQVFSFYPELLEWVATCMPLVFAYNNFGTRQNKGFGCFTVAETTQEQFENMLIEHPDYSNALCYEFGKHPGHDRVFARIDEEYKILKSGFAKEPSQLMIYFKEDEKKEWEKPTIKKELVKNRRGPSRPDYTGHDGIKYIRALLGVAELYEFPRDGAKIKIECVDDGEDKKTKVERFKSPLTFKVFGGTIYLMANKLPPEIYDRTFKFSKDKQGKEYVLIKTPPKPKKGDAWLDDFLKNHVDKRWTYVK